MQAFNTRFNDFGFWTVLTAGITPFPFKVITIMSGVSGLPLSTFIVTSFVARGLRFFLVAALLWKFGIPVRAFIERRLGWMFLLFLVILFGGFFIVSAL
jgi:membrane protein YqaA with SNARE-associated domain